MSRNEAAVYIEGYFARYPKVKTFMENALRDGTLKTTGTGVERIMPPMPRFGQSNRAQKKQGIIEKLQQFFEKYFGIG